MRDNRRPGRPAVRAGRLPGHRPIWRRGSVDVPVGFRAGLRRAAIWPRLERRRLAPGMAV